MIWLNGVLSLDEVVGAQTAGRTLGWGVFTTLGVWHGRAFEPARHLARLRRDAARTHIALQWDDGALLQGIDEIIAANKIESGAVRITLTQKADGRWNQDAGTDISIGSTGFERAALATPSKLLLSESRVEARRPLSGTKSTSYLDYHLAFLEARDQGCDDALLCNSIGALCECSRGNIFWTTGGKLRTPALNCGGLPGIGRELVIEWADLAGIAVEQATYLPLELEAADEVFTTASTIGPRAVTSIQWSAGRCTAIEGPGRLTVYLNELWKKAVAARPG